VKTVCVHLVTKMMASVNALDIELTANTLTKH